MNYEKSSTFEFTKRYNVLVILFQNHNMNNSTYSVSQKVASIIVLYYKKFCKLSNMIFSIEKRFTNFDQRFSVLHSCNSYFVSSEQNFCEIEKLFKGRGQTNWIYFLPFTKKSISPVWEGPCFIDIFKNRTLMEIKLYKQ